MAHRLASVLAPFVVDYGAFSCRQVAILAALHQAPEDDRTVRALARRFGMSKPAVTRASDVLVDERLINRVEDHRDRRSVLLSLTKSGERLLAEAG